MTDPIDREFLALQQALAGRYSIERELGRGGMGTVLLARDVALDRLVAIKLLPPELASNPDYRHRFLREARTAAGLSHPNIVPIHAVEEHGDLVFFVMGFVDGETLRERVERRGTFTPRYAMKVMQEVAWALAYAHQRGVVHRDIKPDNIMIDQSTDRVLVTDFGIAQVGLPSADDPSTGEIVGTARYMSPEQATGDVVDARSDLYSLSATIFYTLTGRAPFEGSNLPAIITKQVTQPAPALETHCPEAPLQLARIINTNLHKDPSDRMPSADEVAKSIGEARGSDFRAPPLVRSFVRNAEVSTMVVVAVALAGQATVGVGSFNLSLGGPGIIGTILLVQLVLLARRLLREGYTFNDIRAALLAEARIQEEEADAILKKNWLRKLDGLWHRIWAGGFGRKFFKLAGIGVKPPVRSAIVSRDATEVVLGRATTDLFDRLSDADRTRFGDLPSVVRRLEERAERLRETANHDESLRDTVAVLENIRLSLLRLNAGEGSVDNLTTHLEKARELGEEVNRRIEAQEEVSFRSTPI